MNVQSVCERTQQRLIATQMGHDAQLDLRVIGAGDDMAGRSHKRLAHPASLSGFDRNVLQVGIVAGQAPRHRYGLRVMGVHPSRSGQGQLGQLVGVGALELAERAVLQQFRRQRIVFGKFLQHLLVGATRAAWGFLDHRHAQLVKKDFAQLLGTAEVKGLARNLIGLRLQLDDALAQLVALRGEHGCVDQDTVALDAVQRLAAFHLQVVDKKQFVVGLYLRPQDAVHIQGLVRVLTRILGRFGNIDLVELDLVRAFAAQVFVIDTAAPDMPLGEAGQAVRLVHLQHITLQHGVVGVTLHLNAVVGKHVAVVFDVLSQLGPGRVFQPGFQARQNVITRQLRGRAGVVMRQWNIGCFTRGHAKAQTHDLGLHFVQRGGFRVQCNKVRGFDFCEPAVKGFPGEHGVVVEVAYSFGQRRLDEGCLVKKPGGIGPAARPSWRRRLVPTLRSANQLWRRGFNVNLPDQSLKAVSLIKLLQSLRLLGAHRYRFKSRQAGDVVHQIAVFLDGQQFAPFGQPLQTLPQVLADHALDLARTGHQGIQRTVFQQPFHSRLGPHFGYTRYVVDGVADQGLIVHHQSRRHAKLCLYAGQVAAAVVHGVDDGDVFIHQLTQVLVAAGNDDLDTLLRCHAGQGADHIVSLDTRYVQDFPAQQLHHLVDGIDLAAQIIGHRRALGFVVGVQRIPKGRPFGVKHTGRVVRANILAQLLHHVDHAAYGPRRRAGGVAGIGAQVWHGVKCPVQVAGAIHQQECFFVCAHRGDCLRFGRCTHGGASPLQCTHATPYLLPFACWRRFGAGFGPGLRPDPSARPREGADSGARHQPDQQPARAGDSAHHG